MEHVLGRAVEVAVGDEARQLLEEVVDLVPAARLEERVRDERRRVRSALLGSRLEARAARLRVVPREESQQLALEMRLAAREEPHAVDA